MEGFQNIIFEKNISIKDPITTKLIFLRQNLENLISNAIKYYDPEEPKPVVHITVKKHKGCCIITVSDNGLGVPESYQKELFSMFKRFHPKVSFGSGLGLYLVKQNAEALGGAVIFKSLEKGAEFVFKFPINNQKEA